jgi:hypothetical protein
MSYRPQFAFATPPGFRDEQFHYSFDGTNVAALSSTNPIAASAVLDNITLQLQQDAEFILRAWKVQLGTAPSRLNLTIKDPRGYYLSASSIPLGTYLTPSGLAVVGSLVVPFESEVVCPAGGFLQLNFRNLSTGSVNPPAFTLYGVKRYQECAN